MAPMCVHLLEIEAPHEPKGRAGCPHPAAARAGHFGRSRRGEDTQPYLPRAVQGFKARKMFSENSHLDPLPHRMGERKDRSDVVVSKLPFIPQVISRLLNFLSSLA